MFKGERREIQRFKVSTDNNDTGNNNSNIIDDESKFQIHFEKGQFYFINGKYENAIKEFVRALKIKPENAEALYSIGVAYEGTNSYEKARESYLKAVKADPNHEPARDHLNRLLDK